MGKQRVFSAEAEGKRNVTVVEEMVEREKQSGMDGGGGDGGRWAVGDGESKQLMGEKNSEMGFFLD